MAIDTTPSTKQRPRFERSGISKRHFWTQEAIPDINADALDAVCNQCGVSISWAQWFRGKDILQNEITRCHGCDAAIFGDDHIASPSAELAAEVAAPGYLDRLWYHASYRKSWARGVRTAEAGNLIVHAGDRLTALAMADYLRDEDPNQPVYLHSFRLRSSRRISTTILEDMIERWQIDLRDPLPMDVCHVQGRSASQETQSFERTGYLGSAYYNRYEVPGAISMLFHAPLVQLNTVETVKLQAP